MHRFLSRYVVFVLFAVFQIYDCKPPEQEDPPRSVNLALETVLEFDNYENSGDIKIIDKVQSFLNKVKHVIKKSDFRRAGDEEDDIPLSFTEFIKSFLVILTSYNDDDLEQIAETIDEELRKYHYKGCKFYELVENHNVRRFMAVKLQEIKTRSGKQLKSQLKSIINRLTDENRDFKQRFISKYLDSLYTVEDSKKFNSFLHDIASYRRVSKRSHLDINKIVKEGLRNIIFDHYSQLDTDTRRDLKIKLESFWRDFSNNNELRDVWTFESKPILKIKHYTLDDEKIIKKDSGSFERPKPKKHVSKKKRKHAKRERISSKEVVTQDIKVTKSPKYTFITLYPEAITIPKQKHKKSHHKIKNVSKKHKRIRHTTQLDARRVTLMTDDHTSIPIKTVISDFKYVFDVKGVRLRSVDSVETPKTFRFNVVSNSSDERPPAKPHKSKKQEPITSVDTTIESNEGLSIDTNFQHSKEEIREIRQLIKSKEIHEIRPVKKIKEIHERKPMRKIKDTHERRPMSKSKEIHKTRPMSKSEEIHEIRPMTKSEEIREIRPMSKSKVIHERRPMIKRKEIQEIRAMKKNKKNHDIRSTRKIKVIDVRRPMSKSKEIHERRPMSKSEEIRPISKSEEIHETMPISKSEEIHEIRPMRKGKEIHKRRPISKSKGIQEIRPMRKSKGIHERRPMRKSNDNDNLTATPSAVVLNEDVIKKIRQLETELKNVKENFEKNLITTSTTPKIVETQYTTLDFWERSTLVPTEKQTKIPKTRRIKTTTTTSKPTTTTSTTTTSTTAKPTTTEPPTTKFSTEILTTKKKKHQHRFIKKKPTTQTTVEMTTASTTKSQAPIKVIPKVTHKPKFRSDDHDTENNEVLPRATTADTTHNSDRFDLKSLNTNTFNVTTKSSTHKTTTTEVKEKDKVTTTKPVSTTKETTINDVENTLQSEVENYLQDIKLLEDDENDKKSKLVKNKVMEDLKKLIPNPSETRETLGTPTPPLSVGEIGGSTDALAFLDENIDDMIVK